MAIFDIDFAFSTKHTIDEMVDQLSKHSTIYKIENSILVMLNDELKEYLKNKTVYSDCRMTALLLNCFYYKRNKLIMMANVDSPADMLLPTDKSLLYLSLSNKLENHISLTQSLDSMQGQWICKVPDSYLVGIDIRNRIDGVDYYIGLTQEGIKILSVEDWLRYYQSKVYSIIDRFSTSHAKCNPDNVFKTSCYGLLDIYRQRHGSIPCVAFSPNGIEMSEFKSI